MNSENFHEYLKNPSKLHQISYQELKSLTMQYPYSPNLRYLLLVKSLLDENKDFERNLTFASLLSLDRKKLYHLVKQYHRSREMQENYALNEDFLELKDLSSIETILQRTTPAEMEVPLQAEPMSDFFDVDSLSPLADKSDKDFSETNDLQFLENFFENELPAEESNEAPSENQEATSQTVQSLEEIVLGGTVQVETNKENPAEAEIPSLEEILGDSPQETGAMVSDDGMDGIPTDDLSTIFESSTAPAAETPPEIFPGEISFEALPDAIAESYEPAGLREVDELPAELERLPGEPVGLIAGEPAESMGPAWSLEEELSNASAEVIQNDDSQAQLVPGNLEDEFAAEPMVEINPQEIPFEITNEAETPSPDSVVQPTPKTSFNSWLNQFQPPQPGVLSRDFKKAPPLFSLHKVKAAPAEEEVEEIAAKSLEEPTGVASETFARLLESQGQHEKAIAMYERLILANPEKSSFFAAQIEKLKKLNG